jgi:hypothetical protein
MLWRRREPQTQAEVEPGRFFRFWRWTKRIAAALAIALAIGVVAAPTVTNWLVEQERERIRAAGEPLTCADLAQMQRLPPGTPNAADVYQQAFDALDRTPEEEELTGLWSAEDLPPDWLESMRPVVEKNEQYFALFEQAAGTEACVFPVEWEERADATMVHLAHMREAARMVNARALVLAADGRAEEALGCCTLIPALVQHLADEPVIIGQLVRYALISIGIRGVEQVLDLSDATPESYRELHETLAEVELPESLMRAARGERAWVGESTYDAAREATDGATGWAAYAIDFQLDNDERLFLRVMREQMEALELPWPQAKQKAEAAAEKAEEVPPAMHLLGCAPLPRLGLVAESCRLTMGRLDVCRIGLALRAYQAEHGRYPDSLEGLAAAGWEIPRDSFTDEPYRYRREGDGFIVWGVGPDLDDDGGKPFKPSSSRTAGEAGSDEDREARNDYDIVFQCTR